MIALKYYLLQGTILLLSERVHVAHAFDGCGFCQRGTLSNPMALIALTDADEIHSCLEWQRTDSLTENLNAEACEFIGPFYEAICGCSNLSQVHEQCDLCGSPKLIFGDPLKGLVIPNSNNQQILCRTIYSGTQMGAVPSSDCKVLEGITDYCGGCIGGRVEDMGIADPTIVSTDDPSIAPTGEPTVASTTDFDITMAPTMTSTLEALVANANIPNISPAPTTQPSAGPTITSSSSPSSAPTMQHSAGPTITSSSVPSSTPTDQPSTGPTITSSSAPSSTPTDQPSTGPTITSTTMEPSSPSTDITLSNVLEGITRSSEPSVTCDLCPPHGTLAQPSKMISLINVKNQTITKSCGALLWDIRAGREDLDESACSFLQPFFGTMCGCSTFTPISDGTDEKKKDKIKIKNKNCKICKNSRHVFQAPYESLPIPGSSTTRITCGGLFSAAMSGAVTNSACKSLTSVSKSCGGCGVQNASFYIEPSPKENVKPPPTKENESTTREQVLPSPPERVEPSPPEQVEPPPPPPKLVKPQPPKKCIDCLGENESSIYIYKDFGSSGTTFQKALSAPRHCNDKNRKHDCHRLLHPELESCVLAPITSFDELLRAQSVIPEGKAAYTAVHKDRLLFKLEAEECYNYISYQDIDGVDIELMKTRVSSRSCSVENWMEGLAYGYDDTARLSKSNNLAPVPDSCESLKSGWTNFETGTNVPSSLWGNGQPSYCNKGPVQEVGAIWAVEANGQNYGDLRDVSTNWPLPGAVYKCCKTIYSCFKGVN